MSNYDVLIVGGGHGGAQAAIALRQQKFTGSIGIVGDESYPPYERPPLSKDYLAQEKAFERILIRPLAFWAEKQIDLLLGSRIIRVDPIRQVVNTEAGDTIGYGQLIWATGGSPRRLSCAGHELPGVHAVRTRQDVDNVMAELAKAQNVCVIGGGYIGLEAAAVLTKLGKGVTVVETQDRVLARVAAEPLSRFYEAEHRAHGVDLRLGATVDCVQQAASGGIDVHLGDSTSLTCDLVIVGIGIVPAVAPLLEAGATGANGVDVDANCRTSLTKIFAIGDCASHNNAFAGGALIRLESVQNANDQANVVAKVITGTPVPYHAVPWFWSNQYDLRLQTVGLSIGFDELVVRGDVASRSFSIIYLRSGKVIALDCVNATKDYVQGRKLVEAGASPPPARLADVTVPLKDAA